MVIKCLGCKKLISGRVAIGELQFTVFDCVHCPHVFMLHQMFRPGKRLLEAFLHCNETCDCCLVCGSKESVSGYSSLNLPLCMACRIDWNTWCNNHPMNSQSICPNGKVVMSLWFEKFKEFAETKRRCRVCGCTWEKGCRTIGDPCHWADWDLCSACYEKMADKRIG